MTQEIRVFTWCSQAFQFPASYAGKRCMNYGAPKISNNLLFFRGNMTPSESFFAPQDTPKCHKLTLEVLNVNIFRFKMQNYPISADNQMSKKLSAPLKKNQNRPLGNYRMCPNSGNWKAWLLICVQFKVLGIQNKTRNRFHMQFGNPWIVWNFQTLKSLEICQNNWNTGSLKFWKLFVELKINKTINIFLSTVFYSSNFQIVKSQ
jgi:hypothetical protein